MKHFLAKIISATFLLTASIGLSACATNKLPSSNYEKVKFAFNGVEKSFKNVSTSKKALGPAKRNRLGGTDSNNALNTLYSLLTTSDSRGDAIEDLEYNQPPMVQFQYIKKVLEKVGSGYSFGEKYYDTMTGDVYLDITTGYEATGEENKYNYTFVLAIDINIDKNDLITADVSFDINLVKGNNQYSTKWYVALELDYDMTNTTPNYTLTMVNENDEQKLPYYGFFIYEYDFVEVKNNKIKEWRKFCLSSNERLLKDADHPNFETYLDDDFEYNVECFAWYKDNDFKKNNGIKDNAKKTFASSLFNGLGLNATEINAEAFFGKSGTQNSKIQNCYNDFSKIYGKDLIYDMVTRDEHDDHLDGDSNNNNNNNGQQPASIRAMNSDLSSGVENRTVQDLYFSELLTGFIDNDGNKIGVKLYYADSQYRIIESMTLDISTLLYSFSMKGAEQSVDVDLGDKISDGYKKYLDAGVTTLSRECMIAFLDAELMVYGYMTFGYAGDLPSSENNQGGNNTLINDFPVELKQYIPEYFGENIQFNYSKYGERMYLGVHHTNKDEFGEYILSLDKAGFNRLDEFVYKKERENDYVYVMYSTYFGEDDPYITLEIWIEAKDNNGGQGNEETPLIERIDNVALVGSFNDWDLISGYLQFQRIDATNSFILENCYLPEGSEFKIVVNNSWTFVDGGIGYDEIEYMDEYLKLFEKENAHNNVKVKADVLFTIEIVVEENHITAIMQSARPSEK